VNHARRDLCGGCAEMRIPTAIAGLGMRSGLNPPWASLSPLIVSGQVDVLPAERRKVLQQFGIDDLAVPCRAIDRPLDVDRVPKSTMADMTRVYAVARDSSVLWYSRVGDRDWCRTTRSLSIPGPPCQAARMALQCSSLGAQGVTLENGLSNFLAAGIQNFISFPVINSQDQSIRTPYTINYNLSVQRALANSMSAAISYVGNLSRHLATLISSDMPMELTTSGIKTHALQPFPQFTNSEWLT
jgi:hypothetical protein